MTEPYTDEISTSISVPALFQPDGNGSFYGPETHHPRPNLKSLVAGDLELVSGGEDGRLDRDAMPGYRAQQRLYRLIDACCEPHRQLDALYASLDEAMDDAIAWIERYGLDPLLALIGVEVSTASGDWRTCRLPSELLCPLLCPLPA